MAVILKQWTELPNAGDVFSSRVVNHLTQRPVQVVGETPRRDANLIAVGSILQWADAYSTIWGAGFIDEYVGLAQLPRRILAVRGPLSAKRLEEFGLPAPSALGDPGVFAPEIFSRSQTRFTLGVVPHYVHAGSPWVRRMAAEGAAIIDPLSPLESYMARLSACELIAASSLHGLIFAHAYGIPAAWVRLSGRLSGGGFKFEDYFASVGLRTADHPSLDGTSGIGAVQAACTLPPEKIDKSALRELLQGCSLD